MPTSQFMHCKSISKIILYGPNWDTLQILWILHTFENNTREWFFCPPKYVRCWKCFWCEIYTERQQTSYLATVDHTTPYSSIARSLSSCLMALLFLSFGVTLLTFLAPSFPWIMRFLGLGRSPTLAVRVAEGHQQETPFEGESGGWCYIRWISACKNNMGGREIMSESEIYGASLFIQE